jgi:4-phytase/acid phosphatase
MITVRIAARTVVANVAALAVALAIVPPALPMAAQAAKTDGPRLVIVVMRHGVRSPSHPDELNVYAAQPWPKWSVRGGYLTPHGAMLVRQLGRHYRSMYTGSIFPAAGCPASGSVFVWADVDERTRATGDALVGGLAPGCSIAVHHAGDNNDALFDPLPGFGSVNKSESMASVMGALGGDPNALADAYRAEFSEMQTVLGCGTLRACKIASRVPTTVAGTGDGGLAEFDGGLDIAADVAENLLLEYTDGQKIVGWGRVDRATLVDLLQLHGLKQKFQHETIYAARAHGSNVMLHVLQTLQQGATGATVAGTRVPVPARFVALVGHDTQLSELAGLLRISWLMRGYPLNETPPGAALVFELYAPGQGLPYVRTFFTAQTLDQMRSGTGANPGRVPVYVPGCPGYDCPMDTFARAVDAAIDPSFTGPW